MHPLGRNDKRALKLPQLGFNGVIDSDSGMYMARSPKERPSSNVVAIDRYRPKCAKKKYFRRFMRASSTSRNALRKCPLVLARIVPAFIYVPCARPPATNNDGTSNAAGKKYVLRMWFVVTFFTEREAGKEWIVKNACENDDTRCSERCA